MTTIHRHGSVSVRFPQDCPDGKEGFCYDCHEGACHACGGSGTADTDERYADCPVCGGTGKLSVQLDWLHDPQSAESEARRVRGWQP